MKDLAADLKSDNMLKALKALVPVTTVDVTKKIDVHPNFSIANYEGMSTKEYPLHCAVDLSDEFVSINQVELEDAGYIFEGEFFEDKGDGIGKIKCQISEFNQRMCSVGLIGTVYVSSMEMNGDADPVIKLIITGVKKDEELSIFQSLVLEGYALYTDKNYRMSFFTLFTAMESGVTEALGEYRNKLHTELHDTLERLQLDDKLRIVTKEFFGSDKLEDLKIWGDFMGLFRQMKDIRNKMAHAKSFINVKKSDVLNMFLLLCVFNRLHTKPATFKDICHHFYPKKIR